MSKDEEIYSDGYRDGLRSAIGRWRLVALLAVAAVVALAAGVWFAVLR